jgi:glycosyltransferase involved in cell wall biosynthesis
MIDNKMSDTLLESKHKKDKKKVIIILPAYNAEMTLKQTLDDIQKGIADEIILVDDKSKDKTVELSKQLDLITFYHPANQGYGGNQKTCYLEALKRNAEIVVMLHPDYQYDPKMINKLIQPLIDDEADAVFGSRMMQGGGALDGGMPWWKHISNILLTMFENSILGMKLTEYHSGFRAYSGKLLRKIKFIENSDDFVFDTEIIVQIVCHKYNIAEIPIQTKYFDEASSIKLGGCIKYGLGIILTMAKYLLHKHKIFKFTQLN